MTKRKRPEDLLKTGRPTDYTPELAEKFCGYVATNALPLDAICAKYDELPHRTTVTEWIAKYPSFRSSYLEAKELQALQITDELWKEADNLRDKEHAELYDRRFRFQQWHLTKLAPKHFGEKKQVDSNVNINAHEDMLKSLK